MVLRGEAVELRLQMCGAIAQPHQNQHLLPGIRPAHRRGHRFVKGRDRRIAQTRPNDPLAPQQHSPGHPKKTQDQPRASSVKRQRIKKPPTATAP
jgi:hypothetical protein